MTYTLYTKPACPRCHIAREWLRNNKHTFAEVKLNSSEVIAEYLAKYPTHRTMPTMINDTGEIFTGWQ